MALCVPVQYFVIQFENYDPSNYPKLVDKMLFLLGAKNASKKYNNDVYRLYEYIGGT